MRVQAGGDKVRQLRAQHQAPSAELVSLQERHGELKMLHSEQHYKSGIITNGGRSNLDHGVLSCWS